MKFSLNHASKFGLFRVLDVILNVSYNDTTAVKRQMCLSQNDIQHKQKHSITSKLDINHIMHSINDTMNMITNVT